jgi:hypothetical protein
MELTTIYKSVILEKAFHPRKARKSRNKSINYIMSVNHPSGDSLEKAINLNLFVFFRVVRGQLIF